MSVFDLGLMQLNVWLATIVGHWRPGSHCSWTCNQLTSKVDGGITGSQLRWSTLTYNVTPRYGNRVWTSSATVVSSEPFLHRTRTLRCLQKETVSYRHWSMSLRWDPDDVPHWRILSPDKTERWLIPELHSADEDHCFLADQSWFITWVRKEEERVIILCKLVLLSVLYIFCRSIVCRYIRCLESKHVHLSVAGRHLVSRLHGDWDGDGKAAVHWGR